MNTKTSVVFSIIAVAAAVLLFAAGPILSTHQALAWGGFDGFGGFGGFGGCCGCFSCCGCGGFGGWGF